MSNLLRFDKEKTIVLIDYETQNLCLNECSNLPWEIALMKMRGGQIIDKFQTYIKWNPLLKVSAGAAKVTGYNDQKVIQSGRAPEVVAKIVEKWLNEADYIVGHNVLGFDYYVNNSFLRSVGLAAMANVDKWLDTNCLLKGILLNYLYKPGESLTEYQYKCYHTFLPKGTTSNLSSACKKYNIPVDESKRHAALYDLEVNFEVFKKILLEQDI